MPFDGSGNFNRVMNWVSDAVANIKIKADRHDQEDDNFASGLSNTITKDGQSQPTANIPMNGKKLVNVGAPTVPTDAATKTYVDGIRDFSTAIRLTGAVPEGRIAFTVADVGFGTRVAGTPAGSLNRFVWNDSASLTGSDVAVLDDGGNLSLLGNNLVYNAFGTTGTWTVMATGFTGWMAFNKATGSWTTYGTAVSNAAGAVATAVALSTLDKSGNQTLTGKAALNGAVIPANSSSGLIVQSNVSLVGDGSYAFNGYYDTVAATWKAVGAGFGGYLYPSVTTGDITLARSPASVAAGAAIVPAPVAVFSKALGTQFADPLYTYGSGVPAVHQQHKSTAVSYWKQSGSNFFAWGKTVDGLATGATPVTLMTLTDAGALTVPGAVNAAALQVAGVQIPFSKAYESAQQVITASGSLTLAHGLGVAPKLLQPFLVCVTAEAGYAIGDTLPVIPQGYYDGGPRGAALVPDATNIFVRFATANTFQVIGKASAIAAQLTNANWRYVVRAWA